MSADLDALVAVAQLPTSCTPGGPGLTEALHNAERFRETFDRETVLALLAEVAALRQQVAEVEHMHDDAERRVDARDRVIGSITNLAAEHLNCSGCPTPWWLTQELHREASERPLPSKETDQ